MAREAFRHDSLQILVVEVLIAEVQLRLTVSVGVVDLALSELLFGFDVWLDETQFLRLVWRLSVFDFGEHNLAAGLVF